MKQIYLGALRARLLYGVIIVLTTCLLIVGGAYRLKNVEAYRLHRENTRLREGLKYEASQHLRLQAEAGRLMSYSGPVAIGSRSQIEVCNTGKLSKARYELYIRVLESRLKTYEDAYPEPPALKQLWKKMRDIR
jgi:hypothetical protein